MLKIKPANTPNSHWYSGIFLFFVSLIFLFFATAKASDEYAFQKTAARAKGIVVKQYAGPHHVVVRFSTNDGESVTFNQNGFISYDVDEQVAVLYDPALPACTAKTDAVGALWGAAIALSIFGLGALLMSILAIFFPKYVNVNGPFIAKN